MSDERRRRWAAFLGLMLLGIGFGGLGDGDFLQWLGGVFIGLSMGYSYFRLGVEPAHDRP